MWLVQILAGIWEIAKVNFVALNCALAQSVCVSVFSGLFLFDITQGSGLILVVMVSQTSMAAYWVFNLWFFYRRYKIKVVDTPK